MLNRDFHPKRSFGVPGRLRALFRPTSERPFDANQIKRVRRLLDHVDELQAEAAGNLGAILDHVPGQRRFRTQPEDEVLTNNWRAAILTDAATAERWFEGLHRRIARGLEAGTISFGEGAVVGISCGICLQLAHGWSWKGELARSQGDDAAPQALDSTIPSENARLQGLLKSRAAESRDSRVRVALLGGARALEEAQDFLSSYSD